MTVTLGLMMPVRVRFAGFQKAPCEFGVNVAEERCVASSRASEVDGG